MFFSPLCKKTRKTIHRHPLPFLPFFFRKKTQKGPPERVWEKELLFSTTYTSIPSMVESKNSFSLTPDYIYNNCTMGENNILSQIFFHLLFRKTSRRKQRHKKGGGSNIVYIILSFPVLIVCREEQRSGPKKIRITLQTPFHKIIWKCRRCPPPIRTSPALSPLAVFCYFYLIMLLPL